MRIGEKHFEQIPIEEVERIIREAALLEKQPEQSPALVSLLEGQTPNEVMNEAEGSTSKDHQ